MAFDITNPRRVSPGVINVTWDHPSFGVIEYTAVNGSGEKQMQEIWDAVTRGDFGPIAPVEDN